MSATTTAVLLNVHDHSDEMKNHPVGKLMAAYTEVFDSGDHATAATFHHPTKAVYVKADGTSYTGEACYAQIKQDYSVFSKVYHEPTTLLIYESHEVPGGYEVLGTANVAANLVGDPAAGEPAPVKDRNGNEWDLLIPGAFHFYIEKSDEAGRDGLVIVKSIVHADTAPFKTRLVKRGVLKPSDIGL